MNKTHKRYHWDPPTWLQLTLATMVAWGLVELVYQFGRFVIWVAY